MLLFMPRIVIIISIRKAATAAAVVIMLQLRVAAIRHGSDG
jgi:hypothetical protein